VERGIGKGICKGKGKGYLTTDHEGPEGEWRYSSTLSLTSAQDGVGGQHHAPAALPLGKRPGTHCIGGRVDPRAGLDGCGKSRPTGIRSPDRPGRSESLYRLSYPGPRGMFVDLEITIDLHLGLRIKTGGT
jgi:hypothetical protein